MDYQNILSRWLDRAGEDVGLITELNQVRDDQGQIEDRY